jgi:hypothetical protein
MSGSQVVETASVANLGEQEMKPAEADYCPRTTRRSRTTSQIGTTTAAPRSR